MKKKITIIKPRKNTNIKFGLFDIHYNRKNINDFNALEILIEEDENDIYLTTCIKCSKKDKEYDEIIKNINEKDILPFTKKINEYVRNKKRNGYDKIFKLYD